MSRRSTDNHGSVLSPPLPADHVLDSGAVFFPGAFDQHGCPLILFPVDGQAKLSSELSKAEVVDFVNYFLSLHNKKQDKDSLVSVVADLRQASLSTARFIAETLLLLQNARKRVHTVYIIQPGKKDVLKVLLKSLAPSKPPVPPFKKVLLKEVCELSNYIDRSQLTPSLGGYLIYCHQSWVAFIKEIDLFLQDFLSVVQRLPACIASLQALSRLPVPKDLRLLTDFCSSNQAKFLQLRRELGLDELQRHCERVVGKLRYPEQDPCYHALAGTPLFTHTALDMLHNYSRITAAVDKVELLWQQAFSKAHVQLQVLQLKEDAQRTKEQIEALLKEKLQSYRVEMAQDEERAQNLASAFEASIYTPAMALVRCSEDLIHTLAETEPLVEGQAREACVVDLARLTDMLISAVEFPYQTLRAQCDFFHYYNKASRWYGLVLCENFLQGLLSGLKGSSVPGQRRCVSGRAAVPAWRKALVSFLRRNPPPVLEELMGLARLANTLPDVQLQRAGRQMSQRCMTLRKLLISQDTVTFSHLQLALQWQYDLLKSSHSNLHRGQPSTAAKPEQISEQSDGLSKPSVTPRSRSGLVEDNSPCQVSPSSPWGAGREASQHHSLLAKPPSAEGKQSSLSSFDSGFCGAGSSPPEAGGGTNCWEAPFQVTVTRESFRPAAGQPQSHNELLSGASDSEDPREDFDSGSGSGNSSGASIQILPKITLDSLNLEIKVQRSTTPPQNPWLSLPVDDLENSYTVTITQNPPGQQKVRSPSDPPPVPHPVGDRSGRSRDQPTQTEVPTSTQSVGPRPDDWIPQTPGGPEEPDLSPIRHVLSSTIGGGKDKSNSMVEEGRTLLWDSYDLHDQNHGTHERTSSVLDVSMATWDVEVQEGLRKVGEILQRADGILEEEENVLSQEAMLDVLLRNECKSNHWALWEGEDHLNTLSTSELAEAGVLGLEEEPRSEDQNLGQRKPFTTASETTTPGNGHVGEVSRARSDSPDCAGGDLRNVHVLDELILEENLKILALRRAEENEEGRHRWKTCDATGPSGTSGEGQAFHHELQRETVEVERMEKSLRKELDRGRKVKRRVVKCSALGKVGAVCLEDQELCEELLLGSRGRSQNALHQSLTVPHITPGQHSSTTTGSTQPILDQDLHKKPTSHYLVPVDDREVWNCDLNNEMFTVVVETAVPSVNLRPHLNGSSQDEGLVPQILMGAKETDTEPGGNDGTCKPEASLTPEMRPDDGAFDPGGNSSPPVPKPRKASLRVHPGPKEEEPPFSGEPVFTAVPPSESSTPSFDAPMPIPKERKKKPIVNGDALTCSPVGECCNKSLPDDSPVLPGSNSCSTVGEHHSNSCSPVEHHSNSFSPVEHHSNSCSPVEHHSNSCSPVEHHSNSCSPVEHHSNSCSPVEHHSNSCSPVEHHSNSCLLVGEHHSNNIKSLLEDSPVLPGGNSHSPVGEHHSNSHSPVGEHHSNSHSPVGEHHSNSHSPVGEHHSNSHSPVGEHHSNSHSPVGECSSNNNNNNKSLPEDSPVLPGSNSCSTVGDHHSNSCSPVGEHHSNSCSTVGEHHSNSCSPVGEHHSNSCSPVGEHHSNSCSPVGDHHSNSCSPVGDHHSNSCLPVGECSSNNNNNKSLPEDSPVLPGDHEFSTLSLEDVNNSVVAAVSDRPRQGDSQPFPGSKTLSPINIGCDLLPPPQQLSGEPVLCDAGGQPEQREEASEWLQDSPTTRLSMSSLAAHLTINHIEMRDFKTPIVLDTGSGVMKAGFSNEERPKIIFPTIIGLPKYEEMMNGSNDRERFVGHEAQLMRGVLALTYPMRNGIIRNWDDMEKIWAHAFQQLSVDPEDHPVLLTEAAMSPLESRQRAVEVMFDCFGVPYAYVAMQAVLALYAAGRCTGVVFDSGDGVSHSVPVYEGYSLPHAIQRFPLAGQDVTLHLKKLLQEQGVCMRTSAELEIVREMKERCCCVAPDYEAELASGGPSSREMSYAMPDGQLVCVANERFRAPEILFKPELIGRDHYGMHESLYKSVVSTDIDLRRNLLGNIVLSGGNTLLQGLPERLQREVAALVPRELGERVRVTSPEDRDSSVWRGGAVLANLPSAACAWISREEYEEHGPQIVFRKCF